MRESKFQHTAARRRLADRKQRRRPNHGFQHTAARRRLGAPLKTTSITRTFQHTAARRRLGVRPVVCNLCRPVSTHSRPKAAGSRIVSAIAENLFQHTAARRRLALVLPSNVWLQQFQHTAARRRLVGMAAERRRNLFVSTHSRPKAAGTVKFITLKEQIVVSTHSRPKAAGPQSHSASNLLEFQHTAARRRLDACLRKSKNIFKFQHTAARRRLVSRFIGCRA